MRAWQGVCGHASARIPALDEDLTNFPEPLRRIIALAGFTGPPAVGS
jgi:hypothetical protein